MYSGIESKKLTVGHSALKQLVAVQYEHKLLLYKNISCNTMQ